MSSSSSPFQTRSDQKSTSLKKRVTFEDARKNRERQTLSIRKEKTFVEQMKRRSVDTSFSGAPSFGIGNVDMEWPEYQGSKMEMESYISTPTKIYDSSSSNNSISVHSPSGTYSTAMSYSELCFRLQDATTKNEIEFKLDEVNPETLLLPYYTQLVMEDADNAVRYRAFVCLRRLITKRIPIFLFPIFSCILYSRFGRKI